jgi:hypothetical protein
MAEQEVVPRPGQQEQEGEDRSRATATHQAYAAAFGVVQQQAAIMSYNDVFRLLMILFMSLLPLVFLMRKPKHQTGAGEIGMH